MSLRAAQYSKSTRIRIVYVAIILFLDITVIPIILNYGITFLKHETFSVLASYKFLISGGEIIKLFAILQIFVFALCIAVVWNTKKIGEGIKLNKEFGTPEAAGSGQHGTARWKTAEERDKEATIWYSNKELPLGGIIFGMEQLSNCHKVWLDSDDSHTLIIGATRSGKSRKIILPTIWEMAQAGESMIFGDPKGELYIYSYEYLKQQGYKVITLDLNEPQKGNCWNMLEPVNRYFKEGNISKATETAWDIASSIVHQKPTTSEPIWENGEEAVIASLILLTCLEADFDFQKHMSTAYYLLAEYGHAPDEESSIPLNDYIEGLSTTHPAKGAYATAMSAAGKTRSSFFASTLADLRLFSDMTIANMTSNQDHKLEDIGVEKTAVFLIIPDEKVTRNVLATLYVNQVYMALVELARKRGGRIPRRVNFILDEFGNLPPIPQFSTKLTVAAGRGIKFCIAIQDIGQLKEKYDKSTSTILGNCKNWLYLITADYETAELVSKKMGQYTVETEGVSSNVGDKNASFGTSGNMTGRALLMPDEVLKWDKDNKSLVLTTAESPCWYPICDLSKWEATEAFGLTGNREKDREIIERRNNEQQVKKIKEVQIWQPAINRMLSERDYSQSEN